MGSKQKRRIARAERLAQHAKAKEAKAQARIDTLERQARRALDERDELRRVLGVTERIDYARPELLSFTVHFDREALGQMKNDPANFIHTAIEGHLIKAGLRKGARDGK
jgi:hypothetical protein